MKYKYSVKTSVLSVVQIFLVIGLLLSPVSHATSFGPYRADLVRVIDGDTVELTVHVWPQMDITTSLRLQGIDTPESGWRAKSACERELGQQALQFTTQWLQGKAITVDGIEPGKFARRVLGRIESGAQSLADALLKAGLARPYHGGKRGGWCDEAGQ